MVFCGHCLEYAARIALVPLLIKTAGVVNYGGYVVLALFISFCYGIAGFGAGFIMRRYLPSSQRKDERNQLFYTPLFFKLTTVVLIGFCLCIGQRLIKEVLFKGELFFSMPLLLFAIIIYVMYAHISDYFRYTHRVTLMTLAGLAYPNIMVGLVIFSIFALKRISINILLLAEIMSLSIIVVSLSFRLLKEMGLPRKIIFGAGLKNDIKLGFPLTLRYLTDFILSAGDRYVITAYLSATAVGYYNSAYVLASAIVVIPRVIGVSILQLLSKLTDENRIREREIMMFYSLKIFIFFALPFIGGCFVLGKSVLAIFANQEAALAACWVVPVVAIGSMFYGINLIFNNILFVSLKTHIIFKINALAAILNIVLNLTLFYFFRSIMVAAGVTLISYFLSTVLMLKEVKEHLRVDWQAIRAFSQKVSVASLFMSGVAYLLLDFGFNTIVVILISGFFYFLAIFFLRVVSVKEQRLFAGYLSVLLNRLFPNMVKTQKRELC